MRLALVWSGFTAGSTPSLHLAKVALTCVLEDVGAIRQCRQWLTVLLKSWYSEQLHVHISTVARALNMWRSRMRAALCMCQCSR